MTTFAVGEVAILQNCILAKHEGVEVTITSGLRDIFGIRPNGHTWTGPGYSIDGPDGITCAMVSQLRKRRPPSTDESESRQAMLDCIERAKQPLGVPA